MSLYNSSHFGNFFLFSSNRAPRKKSPVAKLRHSTYEGLFSKRGRIAPDRVGGEQFKIFPREEVQKTHRVNRDKRGTYYRSLFMAATPCDLEIGKMTHRRSAYTSKGQWTSAAD